MPKARYAEGSAPGIVAERDRSDAEIFAAVKEVASAADPFDEQPASEELALLWKLGPDQVRRRWRTLVGRPIPIGLGRQLTLRILAYHEQVQRYGDLDRASRRILADIAGVSQITRLTIEPDVMATADRKGSDAPRLVRTATLLRTGTVLTREHGGVLHRVLVGTDGFSWQGKSYDSLSKVALAITGTRWNGPRFFGLRDGPPIGAKKNVAHADRTSVMVGGGRAGREIREPRRSVSS